MNLSAPTMPVFVISLAIAVIALLLMLGVVPPFGIQTIWVALIAYLVLFIGNIAKGL